MLKVTSLSITYPPSTVVLKDISFSIQPGESVAVLGANGSGKTSLLLALTGLLPATGCICLDDLELTPKTIKSFRQKIGFVFQNPDDQLFCSTIFDDLAFGLQNMEMSDEQIKTEVDECLMHFQLKNKAGYSARILSGGEKRLAALATVIVMKPEIILLDEPTSFLDRNARLELETSLQSLDQTKIIVTHDIPFAAKMCKRVILLGKQHIVFDGPAKDILYDEKLMNENGVDALGKV